MSIRGLAPLFGLVVLSVAAARAAMLRPLYVTALMLTVLSACGGGPSLAQDASASKLAHYAQCESGIGAVLGTCADGLVCTEEQACHGVRQDAPSLCLLPNEDYCYGDFGDMAAPELLDGSQD